MEDSNEEFDLYDKIYSIGDIQLKEMDNAKLIEYITDLKKMVGGYYFCFSCDEKHYDTYSEQCENCYRPYCDKDEINETKYIYACYHCKLKVCFECYEKCPYSGCYNRVCNSCINEIYNNYDFALHGCLHYFCDEHYYDHYKCACKKIMICHCIFPKIYDPNLFDRCDETCRNSNICVKHYAKTNELFINTLDMLPKDLVDICASYFYEDQIKKEQTKKKNKDEERKQFLLKYQNNKTRNLTNEIKQESCIGM